jgi:hypothetical protein
VKADLFKELYESKTDEELLLLASEKDTLVEAARDTLLQELRRRGLSDLPAIATAATTAKPDSQSEEKTYPPSRSSFVWLGLFLLNSIVVYMCALHLSPVLVGRWFAWVTPIVGFPSGMPPTDWYLQHLELMTIVPALVAGYIDMGRFLPALVGKKIGQWRSDSAASRAWIVPCAVLFYRMLAFHAPSSVLYGSSMSAFRYFFEIQQVMPTFRNPLASDPVRVLAQMSVTAPFYAGMAYSLGAIAWRYQLLQSVVKHKSEPPSNTSSGD